MKIEVVQVCNTRARAHSSWRLIWHSDPSHLCVQQLRDWKKIHARNFRGAATKTLAILHREKYNSEVQWSNRTRKLCYRKLGRYRKPTVPYRCRQPAENTEPPPSPPRCRSLQMRNKEGVWIYSKLTMMSNCRHSVHCHGVWTSPLPSLATPPRSCSLYISPEPTSPPGDFQAGIIHQRKRS